MSQAVLLFSMAVTVPWATVQTQLTGLLQTTIEEYMSGGGYAMQACFTNEFGSAVATTGFRDPYTLSQPTVNPQPAMVGDGFLVGSLTKMITAASVLQLVERGLVHLDDPIAPYIDWYLLSRNGTTLGQLWKDTTIELVTIRHLLSMTSGVGDFDTYQLRIVQELFEPNYDITPYDILHMANKTFVCEPGSCCDYSSTNYEFLGFLLAAFANSSDWDTFDQRAVLPVRPEAPYAKCKFALHGLLKSFNTPGFNVSHGYGDYLPENDLVWNVSATSGWACGNFLTSVTDMTQFTYDLFGPEHRIISPATLPVMYNATNVLDNLDNIKYGLGTMEMSNNAVQGFVVGHAGDTYGFGSMSGYNFNSSFALSIVCNKEPGSQSQDVFHALMGNITTLLKNAGPIQP
ncbi:beta-lactamase [Diplonema papillatum]|nr:beta-lactamase [Diplonema papillatum]|eukprot:gene15310-23400_t